MKLSRGKGVTLGCLLLIFHNALTGWQDVYRAIVFRVYDVAFITGVSFAIVFVVYFVSYKVQKIPAALRFPDLIGINFFTAGSWGCMFLAIWLAPPVIVTCLGTAASPLFTAILASFTMRSTGVVDRSAVVVCLLIMVLTVSPVIHDQAVLSTQNIGGEAAVWGMMLALLAAGFDAATSLVTKRLYSRGVSPDEMLAKRFTLLAIVAIAVSVHNGTFDISSSYAKESLTITFLGVLPAVFLLQKSLVYLEPVLFEVLISTVPAFVLGFQIISYQFKTDAMTVFCTILVVLVSGIYGVRQTVRASYA